MTGSCCTANTDNHTKANTAALNIVSSCMTGFCCRVNTDDQTNANTVSLNIVSSCIKKNPVAVKTQSMNKSNHDLSIKFYTLYNINTSKLINF